MVIDPATCHRHPPVTDLFQLGHNVRKVAPQISLPQEEIKLGVVRETAYNCNGNNLKYIHDESCFIWSFLLSAGSSNSFNCAQNREI